MAAEIKDDVYDDIDDEALNTGVCEGRGCRGGYACVSGVTGENIVWVSCLVMCVWRSLEVHGVIDD